MPRGRALHGRVWALQRPAGLHTDAIAAMDHGRRALWRGVLGGSAAAGQALVHLAANKAVSHIWRLVQDFCALGVKSQRDGRPFLPLTLLLKQRLGCFI